MAIFILVTILLISITMASRRQYSSVDSLNISLLLIAPFQQATTYSLRWLKNCWYEYFYLTTTAETNMMLKNRLVGVIERESRCVEIDLMNQRLRKLLQLKQETQLDVCAAQVVGKDPSPWYKSVIIDKGVNDGIRKGMPVIMNEGVAGIVMSVSLHYAKVLLIIDRQCAVDAIVQRTRAPGIITGKEDSLCQMKYALPKFDIQLGDIVVSSGLDRVYPKGIRIGEIVAIEKQSSGIFDEVTIKPFVDFEKLEEVLVVLSISEPILTKEEEIENEQ